VLVLVLQLMKLECLMLLDASRLLLQYHLLMFRHSRKTRAIWLLVLLIWQLVLHLLLLLLFLLLLLPVPKQLRVAPILGLLE
jgi:hypothetical protein